MQPGLITGIIGVVTIGFGIVGLLKPGLVMGLAGLSFVSASEHAGALGEIRAVYGGMPLVLGAATLQAALDPAGHRERLTLLGLIWLGICAGRLFGVSIDGSPGLMGWVNAGLELTAGVLLIAASRMKAAGAV
jgi:hypothetical protein